MAEVRDSSLIDGVYLSQLREISDQRGAVLHMIRCDAGSVERIGECYFSEVNSGAVKAWKRHRVQIQNIAVPIGRIRLVIFDDRATSVTKGRLQILELGRPEAYVRVRIPPGLWYGFCNIGNGPALVANCPDLPHDPTESESQSLADSRIPYSWNLPR